MIPSTILANRSGLSVIPIPSLGTLPVHPSTSRTRSVVSFSLKAVLKLVCVFHISA